MKKNHNDDSCGKNLCLVEAYFINTVFNLLQGGQRIDLKMSHKMGFNPIEKCELRPSLNDDNYEYEYEYIDYNDGEDEEHVNKENSFLETLDKEEKFERNLDSLSNSVQNLKSKDKNNKKSLSSSKPKIKYVADQCCGKFPVRIPFNPGSMGNKDCCQVENISTIFNTITHMCCADGTAMKLGEC